MSIHYGAFLKILCEVLAKLHTDNCEATYRLHIHSLEQNMNTAKKGNWHSVLGDVIILPFASQSDADYPMLAMQC